MKNATELKKFFADKLMDEDEQFYCMVVYNDGSGGICLDHTDVEFHVRFDDWNDVYDYFANHEAPKRQIVIDGHIYELVED